MADNFREKTPLTAALAAQFRAERAALDVTQKQLAEMSGIPFQTLRRLEAHERTADVAQLARLADAFGTTMVELLNRAQSRLVADDGDH